MKKRLNPRKVWTPSDPLADLGYYTTPVQKVVDRWRFKIGKKVFDANIESLMIACKYSVQCHEPAEKYFHHKQFALEVALAVEKVRSNWHGEIDDKILEIMLEHYITPLLSSIADLGSHLEPIIKPHKLFVLELLLALDKVLHDPESLPGWILKFYDCGDSSDYENDRPGLRPWPKIAKLIEGSGGPKVAPGTIAQTAHRMRLTE